MSNIIRPNFGSRSREAEPSDPADPGDEYHPLHVYGTAAGYVVALLEDNRGPEGQALKVVIGPAIGNTIEAWRQCRPQTKGALMLSWQP